MIAWYTITVILVIIIITAITICVIAREALQEQTIRVQEVWQPDRKSSGDPDALALPWKPRQPSQPL